MQLKQQQLIYNIMIKILKRVFHKKIDSNYIKEGKEKSNRKIVTSKRPNIMPAPQKIN